MCCQSNGSPPGPAPSTVSDYCIIISNQQSYGDCWLKMMGYVVQSLWILNWERPVLWKFQNSKSQVTKHNWSRVGSVSACYIGNNHHKQHRGIKGLKRKLVSNGGMKPHGNSLPCPNGLSAILDNGLKHSNQFFLAFNFTTEKYTHCRNVGNSGEQFANSELSLLFS